MDMLEAQNDGYVAVSTLTSVLPRMAAEALKMDTDPRSTARRLIAIGQAMLALQTIGRALQ